MYLFSFKEFAWNDKIFSTNLSVWKPWDLIQCGTNFLVNLWEEVSFPELIKTQFTPREPFKVIYPKFLDEKFLTLIHWMTYQRYSTYNNVMKYFISYEIPQLLWRETKIKKQAKKLDLSGLSLPLDDDKQNLIIIPDNWSRMNQLSKFFFNDYVLHLASLDTQTRKDKNRRDIKNSKVWIIVSTQSEIFQPFNNLWTICFVDWYKRYYHNQQDPRYDIWDVVKKMQEIWDCKILNLDNIWLIN